MNATSHPLPPQWVVAKLREGLVIPAHPMALTANRQLDERRQRALTRYYHAAGAGGIAVGVHTTQFEIRLPKYGLYEPVLRLASATIAECDATARSPTVRIAGICGRTDQALKEARLAQAAGFHLGLLSLAEFRNDDESAVVAHCQTVAQQIPLFGFYLQPAVGGRDFSVQFWREFASIPNVAAIKIAAFNRYQTLNVVRAVAEAGRAGEIALYTGNDDNILIDLLTSFDTRVGGECYRQQIAGGLLGHWACWTHAATHLLQQCKQLREQSTIPIRTLTLAAKITDANGAIFDAAHRFAGCIPGIHEVLRRQGLLDNLLCLDPKHVLSPGQAEEIDRVCAAYSELTDDTFVRENVEYWLRN